MALYYEGPNPTADLCIFLEQEEGISVLLVKRSADSEAFGGHWALPGGFVDSKAQKGERWRQDVETPMQAALREAWEEAGLRAGDAGLVEVGVYEGPGRDPREDGQRWTKSYAFAKMLSMEQAASNPALTCLAPDAGGEVDGAEFIPLSKLAGASIAFDHGKIIADALGALGLAGEFRVGAAKLGKP